MEHLSVDDLMEFVGACILMSVTGHQYPALGIDWESLAEGAVECADLYVKADCTFTPELKELMETLALLIADAEGRAN